MEIHSCKDATCPNTHCVLYGHTAAHGKLLPLHFKEWGSALLSLIGSNTTGPSCSATIALSDIMLHAQQGCPDSVDFDTLPDIGMFDFDSRAPSNTDSTDVAALAQRHLHTAAGTNVSATPSTIQLSLDGIGDIIKAFRTPNEALLAPAPPPLAPLALPPQPVPLPAAPVPQTKIPPHMELEPFCRCYELTAGLVGKLAQMELAGPHVLRLLTNEDLATDGGLSKVQVAELRDGEERWRADLDKDILIL